MADIPSARDFKEAGIAPLGMAGAIQRARDELAQLTDQKVDAVTRAARTPEGGWTIAMDLIESIARMGDNDLLTTYELEIDAAGALTGMSRLARYRREDGA
jgi:hypothetical protein